MTEEKKNTEGYTKITHKLLEADITLNEKIMMIYLLDCENRFNKYNEWFSLTDEDFIKFGFGKDKVVLRSTRNKLVDRKWILFKRVTGKKSMYKIARKKD